MKSWISVLVLLVFAVSLPATAQITITTSDVGSAFQVGKVLYSYQDTLTGTVNIGSPGASSWDFQALHSSLGTTMTSVNPSTTPYYASDFPTATHALQLAMTEQGITLTMYQYFILSTNLMNPGTMGGGTFSGFPVVYSLKNNPAAVYYGLPSTYGSSWNTSYAETYLITVSGLPLVGPTTTNYEESYTVDAYGPMTLPGGTTYQALRMRSQERSPDLTVRYVFISKEGAIVNLQTSDTLSTSGSVPVSSVEFMSPLAVGVAVGKSLPAEFALLQNYPNPFNPSTEITYRLPASSQVKLSVYDLLGREAAILVDETQPAGEHTATFNAAHLSSGVYLYRLEAGNFTQTRRMLLVR